MGFVYKNDRLHCDNTDLKEIADQYGTPTYLYSENILIRNAEVLKKSFIDQGIMVSYAMKANPNPEFLKLFKSFGMGVDIVSSGELRMALHAGFKGSDINFAGVGKTTKELAEALETGISHFNVESVFELEQLNNVAKAQEKKAGVLLRLNPDIDPETHPHISTGLKNNKFGMDGELISSILHKQQTYANIKFEGLHCHIGSQIVKAQPFYDLIDYLVIYTQALENDNIHIKHIDFGGGFGVNYDDPFEDILETTPYLEAFATRALEKLGKYQLHIQPGRVLMANSGVLVSKVLGNKQNGSIDFIVIDGATTDLIRPALYDAYHALYSHIRKSGDHIANVVGPVCESSDALVKEREIPDLESGELIALASIGAYGSSMGSTYNLRPLIPEVLIQANGLPKLIRRRQSFEEMIALY